MNNIVLNQFNLNNLSNIIKQRGNRIELYFDNVKSKFTAFVCNDSKNNIIVKYTTYKGRTLTGLEPKDYDDYSNEPYKMVMASVKNTFGDCIGGPAELYTQIVDVEYIYELKAINIKTAGYVIGNQCATNVYANGSTNPISYVLSNSAYVLEGEDLLTVAARFMIKDIEDSSSLGYMYHNKSNIIRGRKGDNINAASTNTRKFGIGDSVKCQANLMKNFTSFIPIAFSWSVYTPIWMQNAEFVRRLKEETILGIDMVEIDNLTFVGTTIPDYKSTTLYTTAKRFHQILNVKFDYYNYRFFNELIAGLFLTGNWYSGCNRIAVDNDTKSKFLIGLEYDALTKTEKEKYVTASTDKCGTIVANKLLKLYWETMNTSRPEYGDEVVEKIANLTMDNIKFDVKSASTGLLGYID